MADFDSHVEKTGCDCRAVESLVVQEYVAAGNTGGNGAAVGEVV
jgi:hypothetical protein